MALVERVAQHATEAAQLNLVLFAYFLPTWHTDNRVSLTENTNLPPNFANLSPTF